MLILLKVVCTTTATITAAIPDFFFATKMGKLRKLEWTDTSSGRTEKYTVKHSVQATLDSDSDDDDTDDDDTGDKDEAHSHSSSLNEILDTLRG